MQNLVCYFDGACEPRNPGGNMGIGAHIVNKDTGETLLEYSLFIPAHNNNSNNVAEYMAFEKLLDWLGENLSTTYNSKVSIYGDSKLVVCQMLNQWKMKGGRYLQTAAKCKVKLKILREKMNINIGWVRRTENGRADELSKAKMIEHGVEFRLQPNK